jgi:hypothetical protein
MTFAEDPDSLTIQVWTSTRPSSPHGRPRVFAQDVVEGMSDPSRLMARAALLMSSPRRASFPRPSNSSRRRAAVDRQAADQSTTTAVVENRTAMGTTRVTS